MSQSREEKSAGGQASGKNTSSHRQKEQNTSAVWGTGRGHQWEEQGTFTGVGNGPRLPVGGRKAGHRRGDPEVGDDGLCPVGISFVGWSGSTGWQPI
jgi:hypothetical protein